MELGSVEATKETIKRLWMPWELIFESVGLKWSATTHKTLGDQRNWYSELIDRLQTWTWQTSGNSLTLLIVSRYSTVVVLVVEVVVVVVVEVVSASSQQRPVRQSVQMWLLSISHCLTDWMTRPSLPYSSVMSHWGSIRFWLWGCLIQKIMYKKKNLRYSSTHDKIGIIRTFRKWKGPAGLVRGHLCLCVQQGNIG